MQNTRAYRNFMAQLIKERKIDNDQGSSFEASVEIIIGDEVRYSPKCRVYFRRHHESDGDVMHIVPSELLREGEVYEQGKYPSEFRTNVYYKYPPMIFKAIGQSLHISGEYFGKKFIAVIIPI
ncbi:hypothetical protein [Nitrospirillum amazonense]|uniref:hypothetical protein n=1 Tax=Nitrospirillum amazonense TaxID=28077 RepID=UPI0011A1153D|nr:hypothetical protein [Nitrospirillum amazonense]